mmetsp:Transcript_103449/g.179562  ORF Transcript_103449/g.179562 Transcript_103449/m.179562 type:complete len:221 (-) Transcript_103449:1306-1968(-)
MLTALLHLGARQRVGLVDFPQSIDHLRELRWLQRLDSHLDHRRGWILQGSEDFHLLVIGCSRDCGGLLDGALNATNEDPISSRNMANFHPVPALVDPEILNLTDRHVLIIIQGECLAEDLYTITPEYSPGEHAAKNVEGITVRPMIVFHCLDHQVACVVQRLHICSYWTALVTRVQALDLCTRILFWIWNMLYHHVDEGTQTAAWAKELKENLFQQRSGV